MTKFYDVMVDIETGGVKSNISPIIQLAAVKFNLKDRTINTESMFNRCLYIPPTRYWQEGTRDWWMRTNTRLLTEIMSKMEDPRTVMQAFSDWAIQDWDQKEPLRFWGKPTSFDFAFVQSYLDDYEIYNPFHFRFATDMNSYIRGLAHDSSLATFKVDEFVGEAHDAIYDSINQIGVLFKASDHYESKST